MSYIASDDLFILVDFRYFIPSNHSERRDWHSFDEMLLDQ